jgi:3-dehydroquinate dehydratase
MLTVVDKKWIQHYFNTEFDKKFDQKFDERFEELRHFIWDSISTFKDDIITEIRAMREELTVLSYHDREHTDTLENHEVRISLLEKPKKPTSN